MDERPLRSWWRRRLPDLSAAASRFPLAVLIAGLLTFYRLGHDLARDVDLRILGALAASFLWAVAVDFYVESGARSFATRALLWIAGIAAIAVLFYFFWEIWLSPYLLLGALLILVGLAGYLGRRESNCDVLAVQPSPLARRRARARRGRTVRGRPRRHLRDAEHPVRPRAAPALAGACAYGQPLLCRAGELPRLRPAELHRSHHRARGGRLHHARRGGAGEVRAGPSAPRLHRHPLCLCHQDRARLGAAQGNARRHGRRLSAGRRGDPPCRLSEPRERRPSRPPVLALLGRARGASRGAAVHRRRPPYRRLWRDRAALSHGADRRLGADPRRHPHHARPRFRLAPRAGRARIPHVRRVIRTRRRHRLLGDEPKGAARRAA